MAAYRRVDDLLTCRLTACTPGSAPGPTLGVEYGKPLPFFTLDFRKGLNFLHVNLTARRVLPSLTKSVLVSSISFISTLLSIVNFRRYHEGAYISSLTSLIYLTHLIRIHSNIFNNSSFARRV